MYEQFFFLKYSGGWSFSEAYNLPIGLRTWFVQRLISQIEKENIESFENYRDAIVEAFDEEKEKLDKNQEAWERDFEDRKNASEEYYDTLIGGLDDEIDALKTKADIERLKKRVNTLSSDRTSLSKVKVKNNAKKGDLKIFAKRIREQQAKKKQPIKLENGKKDASEANADPSKDLAKAKRKKKRMK